MPAIEPKARYSGHETFVCRYAWLPKVVTELDKKPAHFSDEDNAMIRLGIGKNMVRSAKFLPEAAQAIEDREDGGQRVTGFGRDLLGHDGYDQFLERPETLWLLHWEIATHPARPLFHWQQMLNYWHRPELAASGGKMGGEFYTPKHVVNLIAEMVEPYKGMIYDLCCGSGGMFIQSLKFVESHHGNRTICFHSQAA